MKTGALYSGVFGFFLATVAIYFDAWWHVTIGRDTFWILPHLVLYSGIGLSALGFIRQAFARWKEQSPWEGPLKGWGLGVMLIFVSAPFDELWHRIFGKESIDGLQIIWSPPHLLLFGAMITVGVSLLLALIRVQEKEQKDFLSALILLTFAGINGIFVLLLMPFSPVNFRILEFWGAFIFYYFIVIWRIAALEVLQRPVLAYLAAFHWFFLSFLILPDVMMQRIEILQLLILVAAGVLAGGIGDVTFVALRKVFEGMTRRVALPVLVGLIYMTADVLLVNPFFNLYLRTGHYELHPFVTGNWAFDIASSFLMMIAGGFAGYWGGPQLGRWLLSSYPHPRVTAGTGRYQIPLMMAVLAFVFGITIITLSNPLVLESDGPRLFGEDNPMGQIPASLKFERKRWWYYSVPSIWVGPDGQRVAYEAKGEKWRMVVDGAVGKEYDWFPYNDLPKFSPDGKRFMYAAVQNGKWLIVVDGTESRVYDALYLGYVFSPDSRRTAFLAIQGEEFGMKKFVPVIDGIEGPEYDEIGLFPNYFKPDTYNGGGVMIGGQHLMVASEVEREHPITDGPDRVFDALWVGFSPDGRHVAYNAKRQGTWKVVLDGLEKGNYERTVPFGGLDQRLFFGPDGKRVAYAARRGGKWFAVIDDVEGPPYDFVEGLFGGRFSPDGRRVAYTAMRDRKWFVIIDGVEGKGYERVAPPYFSPDGKVVYFAYQNNQAFLVVNGAEDLIGPDSWTAFPHLVFSPDGQRRAYAVPGSQKWRMIVDGQASKEYYSMSDPRFSPDGRHVAFAAALGRRWRVVVDGREGKVYDAIAGLRFESPNVLSYIAVEGRSIFRVVHTLDSPDLH